MSVQAHGLKNKEWIGKSDPYFSVEYGDYKETSSTLNNSGQDVLWSDVNMDIEVDKKSLAREKLKITIFDENTTRSDAPLGLGVVSVTQLCRAVGTEKKIKVDLCDDKGAQCGTVFINAVLTPSRVEVSEWDCNHGKEIPVISCQFNSIQYST